MSTRQKSRSQNRTLPDIGFRLPGPWAKPKDFRRVLPKLWRAEGNLLYPPTGNPLLWFHQQADQQLPLFFETGLRRPAKPEEMRKLAAHRGVGMIAGKAGSFTKARTLIWAVAQLVESADAAGVFIDCSIMSHGAGDFLELSKHRDDPLAVFYTFVNLLQIDGQVRTHGMQALGCADAMMDENLKSMVKVRCVEDFVRALAFEGLQDHDQNSFRTTQGHRLTVCRGEDHGAPRRHPLWNPYGRFHLALDKKDV